MTPRDILARLDLAIERFLLGDVTYSRSGAASASPRVRPRPGLNDRTP